MAIAQQKKTPPAWSTALHQSNELKESNEFRLEHLNTKERKQLSHVMLEYADIQFKEGEK